MTATEKLTAFCEAWTRKDYKKMYQHCSLTYKGTRTIKSLKGVINVKIQSFEILSSEMVNPIIQDIDLEVVVNGEKKKLTARLLRESSAYKPSEDGEFGVSPISLVRGLIVDKPIIIKRDLP